MCYFLLRVVSHGTKGTGPDMSQDQCTQKPAFQSQLEHSHVGYNLCISLFMIVCTGNLGGELSWALQTSSGMSGWAAPRQYAWNAERGVLTLPG